MDNLENIVYPKKYAHGFDLLCFVLVIHWLIFPYPSGLLHWHCGNLTIASVPAKQTWWIWINTSCECIMKDCITTTKQSTTKPCAYFLGYTVCHAMVSWHLPMKLCHSASPWHCIENTIVFLRSAIRPRALCISNTSIFSSRQFIHMRPCSSFYLWSPLIE